MGEPEPVQGLLTRWQTQSLPTEMELETGQGVSGWPGDKCPQKLSLLFSCSREVSPGVSDVKEGPRRRPLGHRGACKQGGLAPHSWREIGGWKGAGQEVAWPECCGKAGVPSGMECGRNGRRGSMEGITHVRGHCGQVKGSTHVPESVFRVSAMQMGSPTEVTITPLPTPSSQPNHLREKGM